MKNPRQWAPWLVAVALLLGCRGEPLVDTSETGDIGGGVGGAGGGGSPATCSAPQVRCGSTYVDLQVDQFNCGGCGLVCASGQSFQQGRCGVPSCPGGLAFCGRMCVD